MHTTVWVVPLPHTGRLGVEFLLPGRELSIPQSCLPSSALGSEAAGGTQIGVGGAVSCPLHPQGLARLTH